MTTDPTLAAMFLPTGIINCITTIFHVHKHVGSVIANSSSLSRYTVMIKWSHYKFGLGRVLF